MGQAALRFILPLIPANLITFHFSVSPARSFPKAAGDIGIATAPSLTSCSLTLGLVRMALISLLSLLMISGGVPAGAPIPTQPVAS